MAVDRVRIPLPGSEAAYVVEDGHDEGFVRLSFEWPDGIPCHIEHTVIDIDERVLPQIIEAMQRRVLSRTAPLPALC